jgi:hypothetical protein
VVLQGLRALQGLLAHKDLRDHLVRVLPALQGPQERLDQQVLREHQGRLVRTVLLAHKAPQDLLEPMGLPDPQVRTGTLEIQVLLVLAGLQDPLGRRGLQDRLDLQVQTVQRVLQDLRDRMELQEVQVQQGRMVLLVPRVRVVRAVLLELMGIQALQVPVVLRVRVDRLALRDRPDLRGRIY